MSRTVVLSAAFLMALCVALPASAYCNSQRCISQVKSLYVTTVSGEAQVRIRPGEADAEIAKLNCVSSESRWIVLRQPTNGVFRELYSQLLAAAHAGSTLNMRIKESPGTQCELHYIMQDF